MRIATTGKPEKKTLLMLYYVLYLRSFLTEIERERTKLAAAAESSYCRTFYTSYNKTVAAAAAAAATI